MKKFFKDKIYLVIILLVIVEQLSKLAVIKYVKESQITIIKGILRFTYCENEGAAFSLGNGHVPVFAVVTLLMIGFIVYFYEKNKEGFNTFEKIFFTMVIAGGISNLLDRLIRGYVIDFIDVNELLNFAIFNIADIFIVLGIIGIGISMIFKSTKK